MGRQLGRIPLGKGQSRSSLAPGASESLPLWPRRLARSVAQRSGSFLPASSGLGPGTRSFGRRAPRRCSAPWMMMFARRPDPSRADGTRGTRGVFSLRVARAGTVSSRLIVRRVRVPSALRLRHHRWSMQVASPRSTAGGAGDTGSAAGAPAHRGQQSASGVPARARSGRRTDRTLAVVRRFFRRCPTELPGG
jgi:hypothetical protein